MKNKAGCATYEAGVSTAPSSWPSERLPPHGHRRQAWLCQRIDVGFIGRTVANNYRLDTTPVVMGLRPVLEAL